MQLVLLLEDTGTAQQGSLVAWAPPAHGPRCVPRILLPYLLSLSSQRW